jgi:hypothetical protein
MKKILFPIVLIILLTLPLSSCRKGDIVNAEEYTVEETSYNKLNGNGFKECVSRCIDENNNINTYGNYSSYIDACIGDKPCSDCIDNCYNIYNPSPIIVDRIFERIDYEKQDCFIGVL